MISLDLLKGMDNIVFTAHYGDDEKRAEIANHVDTGGEFYHLYIDGFYKGQLYYRDNQWNMHLTPNSDITIDDIQILGEIIEDFIKNDTSSSW